MNNSIESRIKLHYFNTDNMQNFGDVLNVNILRLLGVEVDHSKIKTADLMAIGSIMQLALTNRVSFIDKVKRPFKKELNVWGSGLISALDSRVSSKRSIKVHALRGKNTQAQLKRYSDISVDNVALGDPGLLASRLIDMEVSKVYKVGIIPHYVDVKSLYIQHMIEKIPSSVIIPVLGDPLATLKKIAECEIVLSSSMHGLIAADSFGIPNQWIKLSDNLTGNDFKFSDYYSVFNMSPTVWDVRHRAIDVEQIMTIPERYNVSINQVQEIQEKLIAAFPRSIAY